MKALIRDINVFLTTLKPFLPKFAVKEPGTGLEVFIEFCQYPVTTFLVIQMFLLDTQSPRPVETAFRAFAGQELKQHRERLMSAVQPLTALVEFTNLEALGDTGYWKAVLRIPLPNGINLDAFGRRGITYHIEREYIKT